MFAFPRLRTGLYEIFNRGDEHNPEGTTVEVVQGAIEIETEGQLAWSSFTEFSEHKNYEFLDHNGRRWSATQYSVRLTNADKDKGIAYDPDSYDAVQLFEYADLQEMSPAEWVTTPFNHYEAALQFFKDIPSELHAMTDAEEETGADGDDNDDDEDEHQSTRIEVKVEEAPLALAQYPAEAKQGNLVRAGKRMIGDIKQLLKRERTVADEAMVDNARTTRTGPAPLYLAMMDLGQEHADDRSQRDDVGQPRRGELASPRGEAASSTARSQSLQEGAQTTIAAGPGPADAGRIPVGIIELRSHKRHTQGGPVTWESSHNILASQLQGKRDPQPGER